MGRRTSARRQTFWEGGSGPLTIESAAIHGFELLTEDQLNLFAPATLVRVRGIVTAAWANSPGQGQTNNPAMFTWAIRKVTLSLQDSTYVVPGGAMTEEAYLGTENILAFGVIGLRGGIVDHDTNTPFPASTFQRATGSEMLDIKAMRRFESPEERLVFEAQLLYGQVTSIALSVGVAARMLFKAG